MEINKINASVATNQNNSNAVSAEKSPVEEKDAIKVEKKETEGNSKELESAVNKANKLLFKNNTHLNFRVHEKTKEVIVRIINDDTGETIKEIPPEKMLDMVAKLWEIAGIIVDEKR